MTRRLTSYDVTKLSSLLPNALLFVFSAVNTCTPADQNLNHASCIRQRDHLAAPQGGRLKIAEVL